MPTSEVSVVRTFCQQHNLSEPMERFMCCRGSNAAGPSPSSSSGRPLLQKQLAYVHNGRREEGRHGKVRTFDNYMIHIEVWKTYRKLNRKIPDLKYYSKSSLQVFFPFHCR